LHNDPILLSTKAVFFDVDFTLIFPGPRFRGEVVPRLLRALWDGRGRVDVCGAVAGAAPLLDGPRMRPTTPEIFVQYTRRIIEGMGGRGRTSTRARERSTRNGRVPALRALR
jgi:hypothetical protein